MLLQVLLELASSSHVCMCRLNLFECCVEVLELGPFMLQLGFELCMLLLILCQTRLQRDVLETACHESDGL